MDSNAAIILQQMMDSEDSDYLTHLTAFKYPSSLHSQCLAADKDGFFSLTFYEDLAGFFCLRGIDRGYTKPSFGVFVSSKYKGNGIASQALLNAENWCKKRSIKCMMLKVSENNSRASDLYKNNGFVVVGLCPDSGQIVMEKRVF